MGRLIRRLVLILALALGAGPALAAPAAAPAMPDAMSMGSPKAKIQIDEYASLTCPHCARFNAEVFPAFKAKYVDTGRVRYVLHEFMTPPADVAAAGWLLARCAGPEHYFAVVDAVFRSQPRWNNFPIRTLFLDIAKANGLTEAQMDACLADKGALAALEARQNKALDADKVDATPTFNLNGKRLKEGEITMAELDAAVAAASK